MLLLLFDAIFGFNINKKSTPTFEQLKSLIKQENWSLINTVTFLSILLSSFDFHENFFCGRICYIIINFFAQFQWNLLNTFEVIAYISNWAFFGCSQSCLFSGHVQLHFRVENLRAKNWYIPSNVLYKNTWSFCSSYWAPNTLQKVI